MAKTSAKGDRVYYGLKVRADKDPDLTKFEFIYSINGNEVNSFVEPSPLRLCLVWTSSSQVVTSMDKFRVRL